MEDTETLNKRQSEDRYVPWYLKPVVKTVKTYSSTGCKCK